MRDTIIASAAIVLLAAALWFMSVKCQGETNGAPSAPRARLPLPQFVDPLVTNTPWQAILPSGMAAPEALRRRAKAQGKIDALNATPHSNIGMLAADIGHGERLIDPKYYPEWAMRRWEALAARIFRTNSAAVVSNPP